MKVIFLDIDGVLVTPCHMKALSEAGDEMYVGVEEWEKDRHRAILPHARFDPEAVSQLNRILEETGAKIVVSSTWRYRGRKEMAEIFQGQGVQGEVIDVTPALRQRIRRWVRDTCGRGNEIAEWLHEHPEVEKFAILDDDQDMSFLHHRLFCTGGNEGLTEEVADMVINHLNNKED